MIDEMPFPIQRVLSDRDRKFGCGGPGLAGQAPGIMYRPVKTRSPQLNGKVERPQRTDLEEFYPTVDLSASDLEECLAE